MLARLDGRWKLDAIAVAVCVLDHDHRFGTFGAGSARHDLDTPPGGDRANTWVAGCNETNDVGFTSGVGQGDRIAVHHGADEARYVFGRGDWFGEDTAEGAAQGTGRGTRRGYVFKYELEGSIGRDHPIHAVASKSAADGDHVSFHPSPGEA